MKDINRRQFLQASACGAIAASLPFSVWAQPDFKTLQFIVGIAPGGVADTAARVIAEGMTGRYAGTTLVENRTGAGGQLAVRAMQTSPADGSVMVLTPASMLTIFPHIYKELPYDPFKDLAPVALVGTIEFGFAVGPMVPESVRTIDDFFVWCRDNPSQASFGSPAAGSAPHFLGELVGRAGNVNLVHVPYRGTQPALVDLVGGQIAAVSGTIGGLVELVRSGRCRLLATSGATRSRFVPDVATFKEQGYENLQIAEWMGVFAPAGTPADKIAEANQVMKSVIHQPASVKVLAVAGVEAASSSPEELAVMLKTDFDRWKPIVEAIGFTAA